MVFEGRPEPGVYPPEQERSAQLMRELTALLARRVSVERIADILGARDFLTHRRGLTTLDVGGFIESRQPASKPFRLPEQIEPAGPVILPPGAGVIAQGDGTESLEAAHVERTAYFVEVLSELDLPYSVQDGMVTETMVRREPYVAFILPTIQKLAFVCNEAGNATYIVHDVESLAEWHEYAAKHKVEELRPDPRVDWIAWNSDVEAWKTAITLALTRDRAIQPPTHEHLEGLSPLDETPHNPEETSFDGQHPATSSEPLVSLVVSAGDPLGQIRFWMQRVLRPEYRQVVLEATFTGWVERGHGLEAFFAALQAINESYWVFPEEEFLILLEELSHVSLGPDEDLRLRYQSYLRQRLLHLAGTTGIKSFPLELTITVEEALRSNQRIGTAHQLDPSLTQPDAPNEGMTWELLAKALELTSGRHGRRSEYLDPEKGEFVTDRLIRVRRQSSTVTLGPFFSDHIVQLYRIALHEGLVGIDGLIHFLIKHPEAVISEYIDTRGKLLGVSASRLQLERSRAEQQGYRGSDLERAALLAAFEVEPEFASRLVAANRLPPDSIAWALSYLVEDDRPYDVQWISRLAAARTVLQEGAYVARRYGPWPSPEIFYRAAMIARLKKLAATDVLGTLHDAYLAGTVTEMGLKELLDIAYLAHPDALSHALKGEDLPTADIATIVLKARDALRIVAGWRLSKWELERVAVRIRELDFKDGTLPEQRK